MKIIAQKKRWMLSVGLAALAVNLFLAGCASRRAYLVPAATDNLTNGGHAAMASADDVSITVTPNAWDGRPYDLYKRVTALKVRIENHSNRPIRLVYQDFKLESPEGETFAALPPSEITNTQFVGDFRMPSGVHYAEASWQGRRHHDVDRGGHVRISIAPDFDWDDFYYAPYWGYGYAGIGPWPYPWVPDSGYYFTYYPYMRAIHLPTQSMLSKGIPEGVVAPKGYVQGFIYFKKVDPRLADVQFIATLQDANTGQTFGTVQIPLKVESKSGY